jgi:Fe-S-cluster-containing dehydrogenase component
VGLFNEPDQMYENEGHSRRDRSNQRDEAVGCNRCGAACTWHHTGERWRLMGGDGRLHECKGDVQKSDAGFEPL